MSRLFKLGLFVLMKGHLRMFVAMVLNAAVAITNLARIEYSCANFYSFKAR